MDRNITVIRTSIGCVVALRKESVDRNITLPPFYAFSKRSLSARRAWIEILRKITITIDDVVALRKESVDRNLNRRFRTIKHPKVALRKESVDRNSLWGRLYKALPAVALRKESVDRNFAGVGIWDADLRSLSARRAWIEIPGWGQ